MMINKGQSKIDIAVLGSCATRDNFNTKFNKCYNKHFDCVILQNQTSIISLVSKPTSYKSEKIDNLNEWDSWNVTTDLDKSFLKNIKELRPKYLILDLFADVFFGCIYLEDKYITNNYWKLGKTSFYKEITDLKTLNIVEHEEDFTIQWSHSIQKLFDFLKTELNECKIILHQSRFVDKYYKDTELKEIKSNLDIQYLNRKLEELENYIINKYNVQTINLNDKGYLAFEDHPWGLFYFHYEPEYYHDFLEELKKITVK